MISNSEKKLKYFDAFPKIKEEYQFKTKTGGLFTFIVVIILFYLTIFEINNFIHLKQSYEFIVDRDLGHNDLQINVDITIGMPCNYLNVDVHDASGNSIHMQNQIQTYPVHFDLGKAKMLQDNKQLEQHIGYLVEQGQYHQDEEFEKSGVETQIIDSCRVSGSFQVKKVQGNFHITAQGHGHGGMHVPHNAFNFTHRIDKFSFGKHYPLLVNPLDNVYSISKNTMDIFQYYISVVPTIYIDNYNQALITNQYAVLDHRSDIQSISSSTQGLFFQYNIEPILVRITEKRESIIKFLIRLSGIIGGIFVCVGFLHQCFEFLLSFFKK
ncbi:DUF1692-domain-containing protein [Neoconidiobolus thromboides FSU 785]|nr:DUF1692-domain-containing protein [Neoconidiobolus thromboides FSU 785]